MMESSSKSPVLSQTLELGFINSKKRSSLKWGSINIVLLSAIVYDLKDKCPYYTTSLHYFEYFLSMLFGLNTLYHCFRYMYYTFNLSPVFVTQKQKKLLGFKDEDASFRLKTSPPKVSPAKQDPCSVSPLNLSLNVSTRSWHSNSSVNENSFNQSVSSPSWVYKKASPSMSNYHSLPFDYRGLNDSVVDEQSLQEYLRNVEESEKAVAMTSVLDTSQRDSSIFWNHPTARMTTDLSPLLKRTQYQLAPLNSEIPHTAGTNEEGSPKSMQASPQVWRLLQLDPQHLTQWNANIRKWISTTVLDRVVKEIKVIDDALLRHGLTDVRIGHVGLDRLKKTAQTLQIMQHIPTLPTLVPFMEISNNQEYLVQRIKELSSGGCMSDFKWNGGGNLHGKSWDESLPTDSAIIMHFFATYLDTQLLPVTQNPEGLPFTSQHFCKVPDKPNKTLHSLIIHQTAINPPHFLLMIGEETCEISKGRNNLIHTLLLFLHTVATKHHGMLGRVNLGKSGVNVLWVVDQ